MSRGKAHFSKPIVSVMLWQRTISKVCVNTLPFLSFFVENREATRLGWTNYICSDVQFYDNLGLSLKTRVGTIVLNNRLY